MIESFRQLINRIKNMPLQRVCTAPAKDEAALETARDALDEGIASLVLVGNQDYIWRTAVKISLNLNKAEVIHEPDDERALQVAVDMAAGGQADVLMRGGASTHDFLRLVSGHLGAGTLLSYLAAFEIPGYDRLVYVTDGGINQHPSFDDKVIILNNSVSFLRSVEIDTPRVAVLSANEKVSPKMPATVEARKLSAMAGRGEFQGALVEGPMALDVAVSREAARQKGADDSVASSADLLFVPNMEVGSLLGKSIIHFARGKMAAALLGAKKPVVMSSASESPFGKVCSLALACYSSALTAGGSEKNDGR
ncbi:MAG: phosphate acyltransferase [Bacillota bacterium]